VSTKGVPISAKFVPFPLTQLLDFVLAQVRKKDHMSPSIRMQKTMLGKTALRI